MAFDSVPTWTSTRAVHAEMIDGAAPVLSEHAARMRIVDHHDAAGLFGQFAELGQRAEVALHAEDAVGDEQLALPGRQADDLARRVDVLEEKTLIAARLGRHPSMMLAWFSSSEMTTSSLVRIAETVPAFAVKPL